jgi:hypothetical protein
MPYPKPLTTVVGPPVEFDPSAVLKAHPEDASLELFVDAYHSQYMAVLRALWDAHKDSHAQGRRRSLDIVE